MIALIQRVTAARVEVAADCVSRIDRGLLALVAVERGDGHSQVARLAERLLGYRVFPDGDGKMNRSVVDVEGELLLVSQFTLAADTTRGLRPGFASAAAPELAETLYGEVLQHLAAAHQPVASGVFGADMQVSLINDGPVTFLLET